MQPLTFPCPKCARRMGVGLELMGKPVRCPHCRTVVVAPTHLPPRPSADDPETRGATPPDAVEPSEAGDRPIPTFAPPPPREGVESIFGDDGPDEESVFESPATQKPLVPDISDSVDDDSPRDRIHFEVPETEPVPRPGEAEMPFVKKELSQPDFALLTRPEPAAPPAPPVSKPAVPYVIHPMPADPRGEDVVDPFTKFGRTNTTSPPTPRPTAPPPFSPTAPRGRTFWLLVAYALLITLLAAWGWMRPSPHPFSTIPDFFGQYRAADHKKVSALPVNPNLPFPDALKVRLGGKLVVGDLEFEPLGIEQRPTRWEVKTEGGRGREIECLVLTARVRNLSKVPFHPFDPAFNRYAKPKEPLPLTAVVAGGQRFPGGPIPWPFMHSGREYIEGQEADDTPLGPGEQRVTTLPAIDGERGRTLLATLRAASGPALWQVHVRRGFTSFRGEDVLVAALIGVEFDSSQVKISQ